jgi:hypothetical protein
MRMMDIKYLKRSGDILSDFPHLKEAQVNSVFDKIIQKSDGSFLITGDHPEFWAINIEDGRKPIWSNPNKYYCQHGENSERDGCIPWYGDKKDGELLFEPGPFRDEGNIKYVNWEEETRKPALWVWVVVGVMIWKILM